MRKKIATRATRSSPRKNKDPPQIRPLRWLLPPPPTPPLLPAIAIAANLHRLQAPSNTDPSAHEGRASDTEASDFGRGWPRANGSAPAWPVARSGGRRQLAVGGEGVSGLPTQAVLAALVELSAMTTTSTTNHRPARHFANEGPKAGRQLVCRLLLGLHARQFQCGSIAATLKKIN
ncbi:hypothetical protein BDY21DRAFT_180822 [Lineolata rhizophorae]|uniref:Uncharacterized protein n=1 Tax=Lineolata rhizophorae TaxID=578093 RepID=A0A6A6P818_9PEZI|nr:hypothetical protein BDY21DRAFT_180822 [Lineolata rhizophorae]